MTYEEFQKRYRYNITSDRLGEGGFGKVYKAYDTHRDRWVAIKIAEVKPDMESVRLKKEVEMVNHLPSNPNIAYYEECYTFSSFTGEYDFGVLQYYEEGNLLQLTQQKKLTQSQKESILQQLLEGLGFLHSQGIIHRDLKPENVLIVNRNGEYIPKITDFGISKKLDTNKSSVFSNSLAGAGTLSYASPEQLGTKPISKNTDLWSFGIIAFWMLTGEHPFTTGQHDNTSEAGRAELFRQISSGQLPPSFGRVAPPWRTVIERCLVTDPTNRAHNVHECLDIVEGKAIPKPQPPPSPQPEPDNSKTIIKQAVTEVGSKTAVYPPNPNPTIDEHLSTIEEFRQYNNVFSIKGRLSQRDYWIRVLCFVVPIFIGQFLGILNEYLFFIYLIFSILLIPSVIKRCNDIYLTRVSITIAIVVFAAHLISSMLMISTRTYIDFEDMARFLGVDNIVWPIVILYYFYLSVFTLVTLGLIRQNDKKNKNGLNPIYLKNYKRGYLTFNHYYVILFVVFVLAYFFWAQYY